MERPGITRSIPGALIGFAAGVLLVLLIRSLQGLEPWDTGAVLVLTPFTTMFGWMWGIGAFNPKLSEHAHGPEHHEESAIVPLEGEEAAHHEAEETSPFGIMMSQIWSITTYVLVLVVIFYAIATLPLGLYLQVTGDPEAAPAAIDNNAVYALPFGMGEFEASQLAVFMGFVAFTILSLVLVAGALAFVFYKGHEEVATVREVPNVSGLPAPMRQVGNDALRRVRGSARSLARSLREGLPKFFGQR